ncbi:MAG TPA: heavy metal-binding domain-containing protein, partial [Gemmataceae bacterium]|nr:heavy metal-binding domain-containing protein [Gemmataceae bacterium]
MPTPLSRWRLFVQALLVRLRFPLLILGAVLLVAAWPWLRNFWDRITRPSSGIDTSISVDTEYWCPMCPGVVSDWPGKCPVCFMALVRRQKGEATPLPDGVVARMQFSPYRVQLAGIRTTPAEYRPLAWEAMFGG